jgi:peptidoglycan/LPS O-acetylase OafA/YrhL
MAPPPGTTRREIELDFIRGVAILMVLLFHYRTHNLLIPSPILNRIEGFGWTGVDVFFVLSGFLVGGLLMKEWQRTGSVDSARFLKRRAFKIWPGYYAFLLVATVIHVRPLASFFWQNFFNLQNYLPSSLSHTWSLAVEEQFYLSLAALLALWTARHWRPKALLITCLTLALAIEALRAILCLHHQPVYFYTHTRLDGLLLGVALAALHTFWPHRFRRLQQQHAVLLTIVAIGLWRLYVDRDAYPEPDALTSPFLITFVDYAAAALLLLLYRPKPTHSSLYRLTARIGIYSYGIYLWHVSVERPVNWAVDHVPHSLAATTSTLLPYALAIPLGIAATKLIEFPFLRLRQRLVPSRTAEPQIPEPQPAPPIPVG